MVHKLARRRRIAFATTMQRIPSSFFTEPPPPKLVSWGTSTDTDYVESSSSNRHSAALTTQLIQHLAGLPDTRSVYLSPQHTT